MIKKYVDFRFEIHKVWGLGLILMIDRKHTEIIIEGIILVRAFTWVINIMPIRWEKNDFLEAEQTKQDLLMLLYGGEEIPPDPEPYREITLIGLNLHIGTTEQGTTYLPWDIVEETFGQERWENFREWISGQTVVAEGVYPEDVERFLRGRSAFRF